MLAAALASVDPARAADTATAEALFREGKALMERGDYSRACPKLSESLKQDSATGTQLALAFCQERLGLTASAWANFAEAAARSRRDGRSDREQAARARLAALEPKLSRLTIEVDQQTAALPELVIKRDQVPVGAGAVGSAVPVDPGEHVVEVTAAGKRPWKKLITIGAQADRQTVAVSGLEDAPAAAPVPSPPPGGDTTTPALTRSQSATEEGGKARPLRSVGLIVGGVGVVGLGLSGYFAVRAKNLDQRSKDQGCNENGECPQPALDTLHDAGSMADAATVSLIAGAALAATGVTLFIIGSMKSDSAELAVAPVIGPRGGALTLQGKF